jgi:hypothetical protein
MKIYNQKTPSALTEQYFRFDPSFGPYVDFLKEKLEGSNDVTGKFYRYLIKKFQQHPSLIVPFKNVEVMEEQEELVQLLTVSLLPLSKQTHHTPMALAFMQPSSLFYYTPSFKETFIDKQIEFDTKEDEVNNLRYFIKLVLDRCYNIKADNNRTIIKHVRNYDNYSGRYYQLEINSAYIQVHCKGSLPPFEESWIKILNVEDENFLTAFTAFPAAKFRLEGFCMLCVEDVTRDIAINKLKNVILKLYTTDIRTTLENVETAIGELLNDSRVRIGVTPFFKINGKVVYDRCIVNKCVGISSVEHRLENGITIQEIYNKFANNPQPYILSSITEDFLKQRPYLSGLVENDIRSFMVYPVKTVDGLMGVFEIGCIEDGFITPKTLQMLEPAVPIITDIIYYMLEAFDSRIERLVKKRFTPLQQSVEWKFNEVAWEYLLHADDKKADEEISKVVFQQVYPLYGAIDIRDSTIKRNAALKNDFIIQLRATLQLLRRSAKLISLPLVESLEFKCHKFLSSLNEVLTSEDELKLSEFLEHEVIVFFRYLKSKVPELAKDVEEYLQNTNIHQGQFHFYHNSYEASFQKINKSVVAYFDEQADKMQEVYPFYFEKYRTDGVEYNIYLGQSIVPDQPFDFIYLKNLRLWQLRSMAHIALTNHHMQESLPVPLQTTQLILVHNNPIDISFRKDERRFDVEGAYNIRYEMVKKRIDKVRIKSTMERLTQPDKVAVVYTNTADIEEYLQHVGFLQSTKVLNDDLETVELEDLQGLTGLKALRVGVNY